MPSFLFLSSASSSSSFPLTCFTQTWTTTQTQTTISFLRQELHLVAWKRVWQHIEVRFHTYSEKVLLLLKVKLLLYWALYQVVKQSVVDSESHRSNGWVQPSRVNKEERLPSSPLRNLLTARCSLPGSESRYSWALTSNRPGHKQTKQTKIFIEWFILECPLVS